MVQQLNPSPSFPFLSNPDGAVSWSLALVAALVREFGYVGNRSNSLLPGDGTEPATKPVRLAVYTVATLPAAASYTWGLIAVSDGTGNKRLAISDGTNWRFPDGAIVS